jgi:hypothetical protein
MTKKNIAILPVDKLIHRAKVEVTDFEALLYRFERNISILGRNKSTFENYARDVATISLEATIKVKLWV